MTDSAPWYERLGSPQMLSCSLWREASKWCFIILRLDASSVRALTFDSTSYPVRQRMRRNNKSPELSQSGATREKGDESRSWLMFFTQTHGFTRTSILLRQTKIWTEVRLGGCSRQMTSRMHDQLPTVFLKFDETHLIQIAAGLHATYV